MCWFVRLWTPWGVSSACFWIFHQNCTRHVEGVDCIVLDRFHEITRLMQSLLFRAPRWPAPSWLAFHRQQFHHWYTLCISCYRRAVKRTAERAASLVSTVLTEVEKVSHSKGPCVSFLASKYWRSIPSNLPWASCGFPRLAARQFSCLAGAVERESMVDPIVESPHRDAQQRWFWEQALGSPWAGSDDGPWTAAPVAWGSCTAGGGEVHRRISLVKRL